MTINTSVEIEAVSKYLYEINGGNMNPVDQNGNKRTLYFDTDCIQFLDINWKITKRVVNVVAPNFYFEKNENRILRPLKNCNKQRNGGWKKAYQAVKHERVKKLSQGNIGNLIRALAALYLLNVYCFDDKIQDISIGTSDVDSRLGSKVFSVDTYYATAFSAEYYMNDSCILEAPNKDRGITLDSAVLIDRFTKESIEKTFEAQIADLDMTQKKAENSVQLKEFLEHHPEYREKTLLEKCIACGEELERQKRGIEGADIPEEVRKAIKEAGKKFLLSIFCYNNSIKTPPAKRELILNKLEPIYPELRR